MDLWQHPPGSKWVLKELDFPVHLVVNQLIDSYNALYFPSAAMHHAGRGMEHGVSRGPTLSLRALFKKKKNIAWREL